MKTRQAIAFAFMCLLSIVGYAQLDNLYIEKYYISDSNDATDTTGGILPVGSVTYRIYAKLLPGSKVSRIFGEAGHPFIIQSSAPFFNHSTEGKSFGKDFLKPRLGESLVALDTYITIGQVAKQGTNLYFGLPKNQDSNGSFVGGINNDGGSEMLAQGLMNNQTNDMGLALTQADGIDTMVTTTANWSSAGILDFFTGNDSTIFGSIVPGSSFYSEQFNLSAGFPYGGVVSDSNHVLLAQLTTAGEINFDLNLDVIYSDENGVEQTISYVAKDTLLSGNEMYNPFLSYPYACGCNNPNYLEYNASYICYEEGSCLTPAVIGCMDSLACNFLPEANISAHELCCYPGDCNNRDIIEVCPSLLVNNFNCSIYPNPAENTVRINVVQPYNSELKIQWYNAYGTLLSTEEFSNTGLNFNESEDISGFTTGVYYVQITSSLGTQILTLFKI
ncbi:MAG: Secretion system C-terminal sorting domain [Bacteroidota bacterium]|jgi:hypothetical protein